MIDGGHVMIGLGNNRLGVLTSTASHFGQVDRAMASITAKRYNIVNSRQAVGVKSGVY